MRVGVLIRGEAAQLQWAQHLGFEAVEWIRFDESPAGPSHHDWKSFAQDFYAEAQGRGLRISALGAYYRNPLDPHQTELSRAVFRRAIEVASHVGIKTVAGFAGAFVETELNERGGNLVYKPFENFLPQLLAYWEPLAEYAAGHGVRLAFEHCPQGPYHLPVMNYNMLGQPAMWERLFNATRHENLGLEWDASHLVCQFIDPIQNIETFGARIFHVHAKDAFIHRGLLARYGLCHPGVAEHRFPGLGQSDWGQIVHALLRAGYDSDLNVEGWHDPVYRDHARAPDEAGQSAAHSRQQGQQLEEAGLLIARRTLEVFTRGTEPGAIVK